MGGVASFSISSMRSWFQAREPFRDMLANGAKHLLVLLTFGRRSPLLPTRQNPAAPDGDYTMSVACALLYPGYLSEGRGGGKAVVPTSQISPHLHNTHSHTSRAWSANRATRTGTTLLAVYSVAPRTPVRPFVSNSPELLRPSVCRI